MGQAMRWLLAALSMLVMTGCFQVDRVVTVKPDGSGTLQETVLFSQKLLKGLAAAFQPEGEGEDHAAAGPQLYDEKSLRAAAQGMGSGVSYLSSEPLTDEKVTGYRVTYAFKDINQLRMDSGPPSMDKKPDAGQGMSFSFTPAKGATPALLVIKSPKKTTTGETETTTASQPEKAAPEGKQPEATQKELEALKEMLDGMRFSISVVAAGQIVETNATYRDHSRIILADIDFSRLLNLTPQDLARLNAVKGKDLAATMAVLKEFPGMKVDLNDTVRITFTQGIPKQQ